MDHDLNPDRIACAIFRHDPVDAHEIALDFLADARASLDYPRMTLWFGVLNLIEKMQLDYAVALEQCDDDRYIGVAA